MRVLVVLGVTTMYGLERAVIEAFDLMRPEVEARFLLSRQGARRDVALYREVVRRNLPHVLLSDFWSWPTAGKPRSVRHACGMALALVQANVDCLRAARGCDAIYVPNPFFLLYALAACLVFRLRGRRVVYEFHNIPDPAGRLQLVLRLFHPLVSDFVCGSEYTRRAVREVAPHIEAAKLRLIRRTVERPAPCTTRPLASLPPAQDIVFVGQVVPRKGVDALVDAFCSICGDFPAARLHLVGGIDAGFEKRLRERTADSTCRERVVYWGFREDARCFLVDAYLAVQPTVLDYRETAGLSTIEAMAAGVPSVVSASGALPEAVENGVSGVVCPEPTVECLSEGLRRVLSDPTLRDEMAWAARRRYEAAYNPERFAEEWKQLFRGR